ncbi:MAG: hypothetical protein DRQ89_14175 [Epsilonproteobacteria bacterium]|nr:MAG: hypothetical protein DRQ89_14175 [Campylobacterota bacterium]
MKDQNEVRVVLPVTGRYTAKDQAKLDKANKFIGRGSNRSSTNSYRLACGNNANVENYTNLDVVFISAEGNRAGRVSPDFDLIKKAVLAGSSFITDNKINRNRQYNRGERDVADFLRNSRYEETQGYWRKICNSM